MTQHLPPLLLIVAAAALAPLIGEATRKFGLSVVVLEILLGVAIGPQGLGWADPEKGAAPYIALFGMGFLFFIAGLEIDLGSIRDELKLALVAWAAALAAAMGVGFALRASGLVENWLVVGIALATTALGVLVPILKDAAVLPTPFGRHVMAAGVMGELGPIIAMSLALSTRNAADVQTAFTFAFIAIVVLVYWGSIRIFAPGVLAFLRGTMMRSGQLPVRLAVLLLVALAVLAEEFGIDLALGALAAGMIVGLGLRDAADHTMHHKLEAIGFGFLVPVFFIVSGMKLDVASIFGSAQGLLLLAVAFVALVAVRIPGVLLYRGTLGGRQALAHGLYSASTLSLIVAITGIAVAGGLMKPAEAAPLVGAGMLTVLLFPAIALPLAGLKRGRDPEAARDDRDGL
jgi:Kef-type K+ transport system membrane component KefB